MDLKWMPTSHMLADVLTKNMKPSAPVRRLFENGNFSLPPSVEDEAREAHQHSLRQQQRQRRKDRMKQEKSQTL